MAPGSQVVPDITSFKALTLFLKYPCPAKRCCHRCRNWGQSPQHTVGAVGVSLCLPQIFAMELNSNFEVYANVYR